MADSNEPKKETVRITVSAQPSSPPSIDSPSIATPAAAVIVASEPRLRTNAIPVPLCWVLLAVSAVILILQIWNYLS